MLSVGSEAAVLVGCLSIYHLSVATPPSLNSSSAIPNRWLYLQIYGRYDGLAYGCAPSERNIDLGVL